MTKRSLGLLAGIAVGTTLILGTMAGCGFGITEPSFQSDTTDRQPDKGSATSYESVGKEGVRLAFRS